MTQIVTISPNTYIPRRLDGVVTEDKSGSILIEYKEKGQVKSKTKVYDKGDLIAYMLGSPGFIVDRSSDPITTIVGEHSSKGIKTEGGLVVLNPNTHTLGAVIARTEVDGDSREARAAERAGKVKVKVPVAREAKKPRASDARKSSRDEAVPKKKKKRTRA